MDRQEHPRIQQLEHIFIQAPHKVKTIASNLYAQRCHSTSLPEVFTLPDLEPYQVTIVEETIRIAFNLYVSSINTLLLQLHTLTDEAA